MRLLVVDDDHDVLEFLENFFRARGYAVTVTDNADAALKSIADAPPDLVLLDIVMPDKSGLDLLRDIKTAHPSIPVIMITAYDDAEKIVDAFRFGALDCLMKPFNVDYIVNILLPRLKLCA